MKAFLKKILPSPLWRFLRALRAYQEYWKARGRRDALACLSFVLSREPGISVWKKLRIVRQLYVISANVESPHLQEEILAFIRAILSLPGRIEGVIVEAGCYKGGSTAKFSLAADIMNRELVVFDSFQGIPDNSEPHNKTILGGKAHFRKGAYCGTVDEVKANVERFGRIAHCRFVEGWLENTLPTFKKRVAAVYIDVDLASSTRTCLKYLYPLLERGGVLFSQDGHLPLVIEVFEDDDFWLNEVGCEKPHISGLGEKKLISIKKG